MSKSRHCECGTIIGERCQWDGVGGPRVRLQYVAPSDRGTAEAAGTASGLWYTILVEQSCAELLLEDPWIRRQPRRAAAR